MIVPQLCIPMIKLQRTGYENHIKDYIEAITKEFEEMKFLLPDKCNSILDIGCGLGGIDVLLSKKYDNPELYLFDKNVLPEKIVYGFDNKECYYNSDEATKALMDANKIKNYKITDVVFIPDSGNVDLVISLLSWGYHYNVETYIEPVYGMMSNNGKLIIDIREQTDGIKVLKKYFPEMYPVSHYNKSYRVCCVKKGI